MAAAGSPEQTDLRRLLVDVYVCLSHPAGVACYDHCRAVVTKRRQCVVNVDYHG